MLEVQSMVRSGILSDPLFFTHETTSLVKIEPILCIELQDTSFWAFDWANSEVVAIGCTNGEVKPIVFWGSPNTSTRRCSGLQYIRPSKGREISWRRLTTFEYHRADRSEAIIEILPQFCVSIHQSAIRAVTWLRVPPFSSTGSPVWDEDPVVIATGGYDGSQGFIDLRDAAMNEFNRTRGESQQLDADRHADQVQML